MDRKKNMRFVVPPFVAFVFVCAALGAAPSSSLMTHMVKEMIDDYCSRLEHIDQNPRLSWYTNVEHSVSLLSNSVAEARMLSYWAERAMAIDFSMLKYKDQRRVFEIINNILKTPYVFGVSRAVVTNTDVRLEREYDCRLRYLAWLRSQIDRTESWTRLAQQCNLEDETGREDRECWYYIHCLGMSSYESYVRVMERNLLHYREKGRITEEAYVRIKSRVEEYLGRSIRAEEQLNEDHKTNRWVEFPGKEYMLHE